jgi:hypothetical protein
MTNPVIERRMNSSSTWAESTYNHKSISLPQGSGTVVGSASCASPYTGFQSTVLKDTISMSGSLEQTPLSHCSGKQDRQTHKTQPPKHLLSEYTEKRQHGDPSDDVDAPQLNTT